MKVVMPSLAGAGRRFALRLTLTQRLFVLALIALLPAMLMLVYNEIDFRRARLTNLREDAARSAKLVASEVEQIFDGLRGILTTIGAAPVVRGPDTGGCHDYLADLARRLPQLAAI